MRFTASIVLLMTFASISCVTQKRCSLRYPAHADTVEVVFYRDSISYRDTGSVVYIPGETVIDSVTIPCPPPPPTFIPDTARAETEFAIAKAWFSYPNIDLILTQKDTLLTFRFDSLIREAYYWKEKYLTVTNTVTVKKVPVIYKVALWSWVLVIFLIISLILLNRILPKSKI